MGDIMEKMNEKIRVAVVGHGNIGSHAVDAINMAPDMELAGIITRENEHEGFDKYGKIDVALICKPTRLVEEYSKKFLEKGINTVDSFDIHGDIVDLRKNLGNLAKENNCVAIVASGWDPGSDSIMRALLEAAAPIGITYTDFGPGMSMGHSVVVRSKEGVKDAISITIPLGTGVHRRMVYVELEEGASFEKVTELIKEDDYFKYDETHIIPVENVKDLMDRGHGVKMTRKGISAAADNQLFSFEMRINNPALTAQIMVSCARASIKQAAGAYTMIEIPLANMLTGDLEDNIRRLV